MGTKTSDDAALYKPADAESSYASKVNNCFDRVGRIPTQIKMINPAPLDPSASTLQVVTTGTVAAGAMWTLGASARRSFDSVNQSFTDPPERDGHYIHSYDMSATPLSPQDVGVGDPIFGSNSMALLCIWEEDPDVPGTWVVVAAMPITVTFIL